MPDDWSGNLTVPRCRKCVLPSGRRFLGVLAQQKATGFALTVDIPLAQLRRPALKAKARGRAVTVSVKPFLKAE